MRDVPKKNHFSITHPNKLLYSHVTKQQLAEYYLQISQWMLPFIINRPLTLLRCLKGQGKDCFFQRHLKKEDLTDSLYVIETQGKTALQSYIYIKDIEGLMKLVQMDVLEIHAWGCQIDKLESPDHLIFDLDPDEHMKWEEVIKATLELKIALEHLGLKSFAKTTGGKGLHVVVPIARNYSWQQVKNFTHQFAQSMEAKYPEKYVTTINKSKRQGKILIDYLRNNKSASAIAPYSTRAKENAPVATPLSWREVEAQIKSDAFTINNLFDRLNQLSCDPWQEYFHLQQDLPDLNNIENI